jgi:hypothetical protein
LISRQEIQTDHKLWKKIRHKLCKEFHTKMYSDLCFILFIYINAKKGALMHTRCTKQQQQITRTEQQTAYSSSIPHNLCLSYYSNTGQTRKVFWHFPSIWVTCIFISTASTDSHHTESTVQLCWWDWDSQLYHTAHDSFGHVLFLSSFPSSARLHPLPLPLPPELEESEADIFKIYIIKYI